MKTVPVASLLGASLQYTFARTLGWKFGTPRVVGSGPSMMYMFPLSRPEWGTLGTAACYVDTGKWVANVPRWDEDFALLVPQVSNLVDQGVRVLTIVDKREAQVTLIHGCQVATAEAATLPVAFMRASIRFHFGNLVEVPEGLL